jgi:hypothetical protein
MVLYGIWILLTYVNTSGCLRLKEGILKFASLRAFLKKRRPRTSMNEENMKNNIVTNDLTPVLELTAAHLDWPLVLRAVN